jgi:copper binding plastocyanin/azurin family protein
VLARLRVLPVVALTALVVLPGARADNPTLVGNVGSNDAFTISLADPNGAPVTHLDPGTYTLVVHDHSQIHDFHLFGPGVDVTTDVAGVGDATFTVNLTDGTYRFVCDPHATVMKGSFTVGTAQPAPPPPATTRLNATVSAAGKVTLVDADDATAHSAPAGKFVVVVHDRSKTAGFRITGAGIKKSTGAAFRGSATWRVTLKAGRLTYGSTAVRAKRATFTVTASG